MVRPVVGVGNGLQSTDELTIRRRYNGPPNSGNGGYTAGLVAARLAGPVEVTLRRPPPLETPLSVVAVGAGIEVREGDSVVALGAPTAPPADDVPGVDRPTAEAAAKTYRGLTAHPFPTCYACGPRRSDGLGIFPGRLADGRTAAPWTVPVDVTATTLWAALDCPGGWALDQDARPHVLGRIAVRADAVPVPGDRAVVVGALLGTDGRKAFTLTTAYDSAGRVLGTARATWIALA